MRKSLKELNSETWTVRTITPGIMSLLVRKMTRVVNLGMRGWRPLYPAHTADMVWATALEVCRKDGWHMAAAKYEGGSDVAPCWTHHIRLITGWTVPKGLATHHYSPIWKLAHLALSFLPVDHVGVPVLNTRARSTLEWQFSHPYGQEHHVAHTGNARDMATATLLFLGARGMVTGHLGWTNEEEVIHAVHEATCMWLITDAQADELTQFGTTMLQ